MNKDKMPLSGIRRILERGEWWDNVRDVSPDEPCPWLDELNGAIEAALDELQAYHDAEAEGRLSPVKIGDTVYQTDGVRVYESAVKKLIFDAGEFAFDESAIGERVFSTRAEAEAALKGGGV